MSRFAPWLLCHRCAKERCESPHATAYLQQSRCNFVSAHSQLNILTWIKFVSGWRKVLSEVFLEFIFNRKATKKLQSWWTTKSLSLTKIIMYRMRGRALSCNSWRLSVSSTLTTAATKVECLYASMLCVCNWGNLEIAAFMSLYLSGIWRNCSKTALEEISVFGLLRIPEPYGT